MLCAHISKDTLREQSVKEHLDNVAILAKEFGGRICVGVTGELIGLLHDMGKATEIFNNYIHYSVQHPEDKLCRGKINHSSAGAKYIYDKFYNSKDPYEKLTAQIISMSIISHHGGLIDCIDLKGMDIFYDKINTQRNIFYEEALNNYKLECEDIKHVDGLFSKAVEEIKDSVSLINKINNTAEQRSFMTGLVEKYIFSCLIDADRYDTYAFMENRNIHVEKNNHELWDELSCVIEMKLYSYPKNSKIDILRNEISLDCKSFAENKPGIYQLSVPTGGGKTLSSFRYAIEHAKKFNKERIFYIIPFTTIIDQNAEEIKKLIGKEREGVVLEHHSNILMDNQSEDYELLTERWSSPIILTTMVQFLNTIFDGGTKSVRRMHSLANSVIIFDEIQSIPIKCINMFNIAVNFLSNICNSTIVLCTATQPLLHTTNRPLNLSKNPNLIYNFEEKFKAFKRVEIHDKRVSVGYEINEICDFILSQIGKTGSVLAIVNTKNIAKVMFQEIIKKNNENTAGGKCFVFHLSTYMCPTHRIRILRIMKKVLKHNKRVICISTQLIEAGVNISFGCVIRSLSGLDSIAQAAGRCNRHGERLTGEVYIVKIKGEDVSRLDDIKKAQLCSERILDEFKSSPELYDRDLLSPKLMDQYYKYYFYERCGEMDYTIANGSIKIYELLATNPYGKLAYRGRNGAYPNLCLTQAFKTAGDNFQVIDQRSTGVIVPYKEGEKIIADISSECSLSELNKYLKNAQQYSVNLYDSDIKRLEGEGGITRLKDGMIIVIKEGFYNQNTGVVFTPEKMNFLDM